MLRLALGLSILPIGICYSSLGIRQGAPSLLESLKRCTPSNSIGPAPPLASASPNENPSVTFYWGALVAS